MNNLEELIKPGTIKVVDRTECSMPEITSEIDGWLDVTLREDYEQNKRVYMAYKIT